MASFFIFAGGSSSSAYEKNDQKDAKKGIVKQVITRFVEGLSLRLTFKENVWPNL
jgi:hypothetical protein